MKLNNISKLKGIILTGLLSVSLLFGGCSYTVQNIGNISSIMEQEEKVESSSINVPSDAVEGYIERVVDGDTMKIKLNNEEETITLRLLLIDTPESVKSGVEPQPYSIEASNFAKELLEEGSQIYIEYDEGSKTDRYNRHLGYLWYYSKEKNQWQMFNEEILEKGFARVGYIYSQKRHLDRLYEAENRAKEERLNIWEVDGYATSEGFNVEAYQGKTTVNTLDEEKDDNKEDVAKSNIVYANGGASSSDKYHSSSDAHGMKDSIKMTEEEANSSGYVPCKRCY